MATYTFALNTNRSHLVVTTPSNSYAIPYLDLVIHAPEMPSGQEQVVISTNGSVIVSVPLASSNLAGATWQDKLDDLVQNYLYMGFGSGGGTPVQSVTAGTGITLTGTATDPIVSQSTTGVAAGSYTNANITVDAQGNITAAANGAASSGVDSVTAGTGISLGGTASDPVVNLANTAVAAGSYTYGGFTVDAQGRLTAASSGTAPLTGLTGGTGITIGGAAPNQTVTLANTAVSAASYTNASITVDAQGRLTAASSGTAPVTSIAVTAPITTTGGATPTIGHATTAVVAGAYTNTSLTVDATGHVLAASNGTAPVTAINVAAPITTTGGATPTIGHATSGVTAGSYKSTDLTIDANGHITAASNGISPVTSVTGTAPIASTGGIAPAISLNDTAVTPGSYTSANITVDAKGRLTAASSGTAARSYYGQVNVTGSGSVNIGPSGDTNDFHPYSMPANTLATNGDMLKFHWTMQCTARTGAPSMLFQFNSTPVAAITIATCDNVDVYAVNLTLTRMSNTTCRIDALVVRTGSTAVQNYTSLQTLSSGTFTSDAFNSAACRVRCNAGGAGNHSDWTCLRSNVQYLAQ